ncbi:SH3 domain-containing protein [Pseudodonghicola flavimaris]|uniref:SH3 domain-containing protein n=1 Tax=Pseudodonghicola flavimaris TaxID=3050036 RepID=A0ABT7F1H8_9RHOB|nr:SH3 domain-containing protein [Pseudodonghicola flavimaris]MDK3018461.1 SH3 domain-containing protein [Pseudodonghicola flavimaris]
MVRTLLTPVTLAVAIALSTGTASADSLRYVREGVSLNARSGPGSSYAAKRVLAPGTKITVIGTQGDWARIRTADGLLLWVFSSYLMDQAPQSKTAPAPQQPVKQQVRAPQKQPPQQQAKPQAAQSQQQPQKPAPTAPQQETPRKPNS